MFCLDSDPSFEANFVLATLADTSTQVSCSQHSTQRSTYKEKSMAKKDNRFVIRSDCDKCCEWGMHIMSFTIVYFWRSC